MKNELRKNCVIDGCEDKEKEEYINELSNSLRNYIKTGVKNYQLDEFIGLEETFQKKYNEQFNLSNQQLEKTLRDAAYLSHINMLYELYEQEEVLRKEENEYEQQLEKFEKMPNVLRTLYEKKRVEINILQKQANVSQSELMCLLARNKKYFNICPKAKEVQISLSAKGKKYYNYLKLKEKLGEENE